MQPMSRASLQRGLRRSPSPAVERGSERRRGSARLSLAAWQLPRHLSCLEDPVPRWNLGWYRLLREKTALPIALHVHLPTSNSGRARRTRCGPFNSRRWTIQFWWRHGEFSAPGRPRRRRRHPLLAWEQVDLGILEAASLQACAAARNCTLASDLFGELVRENDLIRQPLEIKDGRMRVPQAPGLGVELDLKAVEKYRVK